MNSLPLISHRLFVAAVWAREPRPKEANAPGEAGGGSGRAARRGYWDSGAAGPAGAERAIPPLAGCCLGRAPDWTAAA